MVDARRVLPVRRVPVYKPACTEVRQVDVEAAALHERTPAEQRAHRREDPAGRRQPLVRVPVDLVHRVAERRVEVVVGVLHQGAVRAAGAGTAAPAATT